LAKAATAPAERFATAFVIFVFPVSCCGDARQPHH
jgi:hypothetical protein